MATGLFKNIIFFSSIIFIHEIGHFLIAKYFKWNIDKIYFYPYGGYTKFNDDLNRPLYQELIIMLAGPLFQIMYFMIVVRFLNMSEIILFKNYHYAILCFNLLPIYPLDGGKLVNIFLGYCLSFKNSLIGTIFISYIVLLIIVIVFIVVHIPLSLSLALVFGLVICKLTSEFKKSKFYYNKFLLERYLHSYSFSKIKVIKDLKQMHRDYRHVVYSNRRTYSEKEAVARYFANTQQKK